LEDRRVPSVTAVDDHFTTTPGTPTNLNVLANDSNPTRPGLQVLSSTAVSPSGPTLTQNAAGPFTFSSAATRTFSFRSTAPHTAPGRAQEGTAPDGAAGDSLGPSAGVSGDTGVVGAGFPKVGSNVQQGAAYVFVRAGATWSQQQELTAADGAAGDQFGVSVAV